MSDICKYSNSFSSLLCKFSVICRVNLVLWEWSMHPVHSCFSDPGTHGDLGCVVYPVIFLAKGMCRIWAIGIINPLPFMLSSISTSHRPRQRFLFSYRKEILRLFFFFFLPWIDTTFCAFRGIIFSVFYLGQNSWESVEMGKQMTCDYTADRDSCA